jgi:hypothetical protein
MKKTKSLYHGQRFPAVVISCAVRWYFRLSLSLRDIEELLLERGVVVTYETIRCWCEWNERPPQPMEICRVLPLPTGGRNRVPKLEDHKDLPRQIGVAIMTHTIVGVDIAKNVMQVHWVDPDSGEIVNKPIKRAVFLEYFANRSPCLIGMESCGGSQHWARRLIEMGHRVKLMPAKFVNAFVTGNKNDSADARAIWMAMQVPSKGVTVKTEAQQAVLALHRMRQQLVKFRTMQINSLRGLLTEYGEVMGVGRAALDRTIAGVLEKALVQSKTVNGLESSDYTN